jgi:amidohydrolase
MILKYAQEQLPRAIELRRRIHACPELGLELPETRAAILGELADLSLEVRTCTTTSGIVATLRGSRPGPTLLLRADMDALPMSEDNALDFKSRHPGRMHACGHDAHVAMLVGAARVLAQTRGELAGAVKFMFQPGEEGFFGARHMIEEGVLETPRVDAAFAIHVDPRTPSGTVETRRGPLLASSDNFTIEVVGKGGHASMPHDAVDPIPVACEIVLALQTLVTRQIDVFRPVVLTVAKIEAGTTSNVIPETARLRGTLRAVSEESGERARAGMERLVAGIAAAHGLEARIKLEKGYPVTANDPSFVGFVLDTSRALLGESQVHEMPSPIMGAEDFSYVLQRVPGAMVFLGARPEGVRDPAPCHSNLMQIDENAMATGIGLHVAVARAYLA